jgi:hypothetical protein
VPAEQFSQGSVVTASDTRDQLVVIHRLSIASQRRLVRAHLRYEARSASPAIGARKPVS